MQYTYSFNSFFCVKRTNIVKIIVPPLRSYRARQFYRKESLLHPPGHRNTAAVLRTAFKETFLCFFCYFHTSQVKNTHHQVTRGRPKFGTSSLKIYRYIIKFHLCVISGYPRGVDEICAILGFYATCNGSFLPTFRVNISVPSSRVKHSAWPLKM
jgi:hypothetical protein